MPKGVYVRSPEIRAKMRVAMRGNIRGLGYKHTPEARAKISAATRGEKHPRWNGGRCLHSKGYVQLASPTHPRAHFNGYVYEHRLVMEAHMGRVLLSTEEVHHGPGGRGDNRIENLALCQNADSHKAIHSGEIYLPW